MPAANIVVIHGLGAKPPEALLTRRYLKFLRQGAATTVPKRQFHAVYWANVIAPRRRPLTPAQDEFLEGGRNFRPFTRLERAVFQVRGELREMVADKIERQFEQALVGASGSDAPGKDFLNDVSANVVDRLARCVYSRFAEDLHGYFFGGRGDAVRKTLTDVLDSFPPSSKTCLIGPQHGQYHRSCRHSSGHASDRHVDHGGVAAGHQSRSETDWCDCGQTPIDSTAGRALVQLL